GQRDAAACGPPRFAADLPGRADAARRQYDGLRRERDQPSRLAPVADRAGHAPRVDKQVTHGALHEHIDALRDGAVLERADHLEPGAVADVREPRGAMPAEVTP